MIKPIEHFILRNLQPTYSDTESVTCLELVGKNTTKINEIVEVVNSFIDEVNTTIETFITDTTKDYETFKVAMEQKFQDFIDIIDLKCKDQDKHIEEELLNIKNLALEYCKEQLDNIKVEVEKLVDEKLATFKTELDESNENLKSEINTSNETFKNELIETNENLKNELTELVNNSLDSKQDTLIAGDNITIEDNVISASSENNDEMIIIRLSRNDTTDRSNYYNNDENKEKIRQAVMSKKPFIVIGSRNYQNNCVPIFIPINDYSTETSISYFYLHSCNLSSFNSCKIKVVFNDYIYSRDAIVENITLENYSVFNWLSPYNTDSYTPTSDYNIPHKKYVDDLVATNVENLENSIKVLKNKYVETHLNDNYDYSTSETQAITGNCIMSGLTYKENKYKCDYLEHILTGSTGVSRTIITSGTLSSASDSGYVNVAYNFSVNLDSTLFGDNFKHEIILHLSDI